MCLHSLTAERRPIRSFAAPTHARTATRGGFARVLAQCTPVLLLDEPTASLDLYHQERVMRIARAVADDGGGVLVVAHDLNLAAAYADRICLLHHGRILTSGTPWSTLDENVLERVFGQRMIVAESPAGGSPLVVPVRASS